LAKVIHQASVDGSLKFYAGLFVDFHLAAILR
jgi:hypothetical protein